MHTVRLRMLWASKAKALLAVVGLLLAPVAMAQRVVVMELDGDNDDRLRAQVEAAIEKAGVLEVVPLGTYRAAVTKKKLKGAAGMTPAAVARVGKELALDAAIGGAVSGGQLQVYIYDRTGEQLWSKSLPVKKGLLSDDFANRLAKATAAAAKNTVAAAPGEGSTEVSGPSSSSTGGGVVATMPEVDLSKPVEAPEQYVETDPDVTIKPKTTRIPYVRASIAFLATWRSQCLRPGVTSCAQYDAAEQKPIGVIIDFRSGGKPYPGAIATLDLFPFAASSSRVLQGFGILGMGMFGASTTEVREESPQGQGVPTLIRSADFGYSLQAAWRYHFQMGYGSPQPFGWAGLRFGIQGRIFEIDPQATVPLPSSQRYIHPVAGLDVSIPIAQYFRVDLGGSISISPRPSDEQIIGYGNLSDRTGGVVSTGFGLEGGFSGDLYKSLGWVARVRYAGYVDQYYGQGQKWTICDDSQPCTGVGEEGYIGAQIGLQFTY